MTHLTKLSHPRGLAALLSLTALVGCGTSVAGNAGIDEGGSLYVAPPAIARTYTGGSTTSAGSDRFGSDSKALNSGHGITYTGGHIMSGTVHVYYIWYGSWSNNSALTIASNFMNSLSGSSYYNINTLYDDNFGSSVSNSVTLAGVTTDNYSQGSNLSSSQVGSVVDNAIKQGRLPEDTNGVYFVLTSSDVAQYNSNGQSFCGAYPNGYCGWHTYLLNLGTGKTIKFAFVGNGDRCPSLCRPYRGPSGNDAADAMVNEIARQLVKTVTDPLVNAWRNPDHSENADLCTWNFGSGTYYAPNGAVANIRLGGSDYLIQQNWVNTSSGYCGMSYQTPTTCGVLSPDQHLSIGKSIPSCDGRFSLVMQTDGNLVLYQNGGGALWASNTGGTTGATATMQSDGNFVLYNTTYQALWNSGTGGNQGATLAIQNDGNLVVYSTNGIPLWNSGTSGH